MNNNREKNLHWYPGHMAKALREIEERSRAIDVIVELCDARIPASSRNPYLAQVAPGKKRLLLLNKADLADPRITSAWIKKLNSVDQRVLAVSLNEKRDLTTIFRAVESLMVDKRSRDQARGLKPRAIRLLITGIPNVGKSTLINKLAGRKAAMVANRPGATRAQQYIKVGRDLELIDTPGVLPPNYDNPEAAEHLALLKAIPLNILPLEQLAYAAINFLMQKYPNYLTSRYGLEIEAVKDNPAKILEKVSLRRGYIPLGADHFERAEKTILLEMESGKLGPLSLEEPTDA